MVGLTVEPVVAFWTTAADEHMGFGIVHSIGLSRRIRTVTDRSPGVGFRPVGANIPEDTA